MVMKWDTCSFHKVPLSDVLHHMHVQIICDLHIFGTPCTFVSLSCFYSNWLNAYGHIMLKVKAQVVYTGMSSVGIVRCILKLLYGVDWVRFFVRETTVIKTMTWYTAIFLTNGLCVVCCSLLQCLPFVYPGWGQKSELFCLLVTTRRLRCGTVVGYRSTMAALL